MATRRVRIAHLAQLPCDTNRGYKVQGIAILLCRTASGVFAVENRCPHQLSALEGGKLRGNFLFCPAHGARFDLRTGATVGTLAKTGIRTFPLIVDQDENIEVELPDGNESTYLNPEGQPMSTNPQQANKQVVARFLRAFSSGEVDPTLAMMTDDATWWVAGTLPISGCYGKEAFKALLGKVLEACTGPIEITPRSFVAEDDSVAVEAESFTRTLNGRVYNNQYHFLFRVRDGKIANVREYLDTMHANAVLCTP